MAPNLMEYEVAMTLDDDLVEEVLKCSASLLHQDNNVAIVNALHISDEFGFIKASGVARRNPIDKHNPGLARKLAMARAYEALARKLARRANGELVHFENEQKAKANKIEPVTQSKTRKVVRKTVKKASSS